MSGATGQIAGKLAAELAFKPERIEDASSRQGLFNFIRSGFETTFKIRPRIKMPEHYQPDAQNKYEAVKDELEKITGTRCRIFESYCSKDMSGIDVHALFLRLKKTD